MYKVIIVAGYGSGAPAHQYFTARGVGMSRSVKTAVRLAWAALGRDVDVQADGRYFVPVLEQMTILRGTRVISKGTL